MPPAVISIIPHSTSSRLSSIGARQIIDAVEAVRQIARR
jgi:hypothetical protein